MNKITGKFNPIALTIFGTIFSLTTLAYLTSQPRTPESPEDEAKRKIAAQDVLNIANAVAKYSSTKHFFPKNFEELVPDFIAIVPLDPYANKYMLYGGGEDRLFVSYLGKDGRTKGYEELDIDIIVTVEREGDRFIVK